MFALAVVCTPFFYGGVGIAYLAQGTQTSDAELSITPYCVATSYFYSYVSINMTSQPNTGMTSIRNTEITIGSVFLTLCVCCVFPCICLLIVRMHWILRCVTVCCYLAVLGGFLGFSIWWLQGRSKYCTSSTPTTYSGYYEEPCADYWRTQCKPDLNGTMFCNMTLPLYNNMRVFGPMLSGAWYTEEQHKSFCYVTSTMVYCAIGTCCLSLVSLIVACIAMKKSVENSDYDTI